MLERALAYRFKEGKLQPVEHPHIPSFQNLLHIDRQKEELKRNTQKLVMGLHANDVLLWGDRGTGKSSLVKSMLGLFGKDGLRIIQVYKMDIEHISDLYGILRGSPLKFILFFDDLSFEKGDESYRILKSMMDGDVEERPPNVVIYATSNRRNLMADVEGSELFPEESAIERWSLVERFGIRLGFFAFGMDQYLDVVKHYLTLKGITWDEEIRAMAVRWATERGSFSGRTAWQFVKYLEGELHVGYYRR
ncbi:protein of unknown function DUF815 [Thermocrinis albus DSM 14484]|uniref:Uncharacterized protein n=1 Tax=Thermocrinis albus (strain DSM 14484 / JCM 11386 / HI 11/12) TaxID=638303 RepID=D3SM86_THEAH|nr:ATP-binding protein [Thermocrinis albus]ADC89866.1 protein of unknown function DUF815 [Thermocrinis albus DSM 14484]